MPDDLTEKIRENAEGPQSASNDVGSFSSHSLPDQIAADKYLKSSGAVDLPKKGLRFNKLCPPGAP